LFTSVEGLAALPVAFEICKPFDSSPLVQAAVPKIRFPEPLVYWKSANLDCQLRSRHPASIKLGKLCREFLGPRSNAARRRQASTVSQVLCRHSHMLWTHRIYPLPVLDVNLRVLPSGITASCRRICLCGILKRYKRIECPSTALVFMFDPLAKGIARSVGTGRQSSRRALFIDRPRTFPHSDIA
jgi:hypothetical protein